MPSNYQAHNVLGKYLEGKGKLPEALAEYKKSLELEWEPTTRHRGQDKNREAALPEVAHKQSWSCSQKYSAET